jgi:DNA-binding GntR family transcriptional regulator
MHFSLAAPRQLTNCAGPHDHGDIAEAILGGRADRAAKLMLGHLAGLVTLQAARPPQHQPVDLKEAFRDIDGQPVRQVASRRA